jgi:GxxExxY protein
MNRRGAEDAKTLVEENRVSEAIIGAAIEVHRHLGPGLLESAYEACLCRDLTMRALPFVRQRELPLDYKGVQVDCGFRLDLVVADPVIVEVKAVDELLPIHKAQLLTYLRLTGLRLGLLLNFNVTALRRGIARVALGLPENPSAPSAPLR